MNHEDNLAPNSCISGIYDNFHIIRSHDDPQTQDSLRLLWEAGLKDEGAPGDHAQGR